LPRVKSKVLFGELSKLVGNGTLLFSQLPAERGLGSDRLRAVMRPNFPRVTIPGQCSSFSSIARRLSVEATTLASPIVELEHSPVKMNRF